MSAVCSSGGVGISSTTRYPTPSTPSTSCTSATLADDRSPGGDELAVSASERRLATSVLTCGLQAAFSRLPPELRESIGQRLRVPIGQSPSSHHAHACRCLPVAQR